MRNPPASYWTLVQYKIRTIPLLGPAAAAMLKQAVRDIVFEVIHRILSDTADKKNQAFIEEIANNLFIETPHMETEIDRQFLQIVIEVLELVKNQVSIKHWLETLRQSDSA